MLIPSKFSGYQRDGRRVYPGGKGGGGPDPRAAEASMKQVELAERQYNDYIKEGGDRDWMHQIGEDSIAIQRAQADKAAELTDYQMASMKRNDDRYFNNTVPYQDRLDADIEKMYSQGGIDQQVGNAVADVNASVGNANAQQARGLTRMGVNPNSGAYRQMSNSNSLGQASMMASAANKTRTAAEQAGLATRFQSLGAKLGMAGLGATNAGLATSGMGMGLNAAAGMGGSAANTIQANNQTYAGVSAGYGSAASGLNGSSQIATQAAGQKQEATGAAIGGVVTIAAAVI